MLPRVAVIRARFMVTTRLFCTQQYHSVATTRVSPNPYQSRSILLSSHHVSQASSWRGPSMPTYGACNYRLASQKRYGAATIDKCCRLHYFPIGQDGQAITYDHRSTARRSTVASAHGVVIHAANAFLRPPLQLHESPYINYISSRPTSTPTPPGRFHAYTLIHLPHDRTPCRSTNHILATQVTNIPTSPTLHSPTPTSSGNDTKA